MNESLKTKAHLGVAFGSDMREFALLWLVFSLLDVLIKNDLTTRWFVGNLSFSMSLWALGAYIEVKVRKEG